MALTYKAPCVKSEKTENLWLQLSNVACNIKCKYCYLDCHHDTRKKNFLSMDKILEVFKNNLDLKMIYITGGEPFLHPKINEIISVCLKKSDITLFSNGTLLSEKKIKVLADIQSKTEHRIIFKFSLDHYTEGRNDEYRAAGVFKKVIKALSLTQKYGFKTNINCTNFKKENEESLVNGFLNLFEKNGINLTSKSINIVPLLNIGNYAKYYGMSDIYKNVTFEDIKEVDFRQLDCQNSRVLTQDGIYSCPALVNDPRGKLGSTLKDASSTVYLETQTCYTCISRKSKLFG